MRRRDQSVVAVVGQGSIGKAIASRLEVAGVRTLRVDVGQAIPAEAALIIITVTLGEESMGIVEAVVTSGLHATIIDLTTQSPSTVARSADTAERCGASYHAGGLTGGLAGVVAGNAVVLVGGSGLNVEHCRVLGHLGSVLWYPTAHAAVAAKLVHNWHLLVTSWSLAVALRAGAVAGITPAEVCMAIDSGPAGRRVPNHSLFRDAIGPASTSYSVRLANKDLPSICEFLGPMHGDLTRAFLAWCGSCFESVPGDAHFTTAMLSHLQASHGE